MFEASIVQAGYVYATLRSRQVRGHGEIVPRLRLEVEGRAPQQMQAEILSGSATLVVEGDVAGIAVLDPVLVTSHGVVFSVEVPIERSTLDRVEAATGDGRLRLALGMRGVMRVRDDSPEPRGVASQLPRGEWHLRRFGDGQRVELLFEIERSAWFSEVREPLGTLRYISVEIALPKQGQLLERSTEHLRNAERDLAAANASGTLANCRAAIEAIPGHPKEILGDLVDRDEAAKLDGLLLAASKFLHRGRHVGGDGAFPVDQADARFALNLTRVLIAHVSHVLQRA